MEVNKNSMKDSPSLSAQEALEMLSEVHPEVHRGLDHGCSRARIFFQAAGNEMLDRSLRSMLVRYWAKIHLQSSFHDVQLDNLSLCGLSLLLNEMKSGSRTYTVRLKIWKSVEDQLPAPGNSGQKVQFYTQPHLPFPKTEEGDPQEVLRFAVLWNQTTDGILAPLWLVAPKNFNEATGAIDVWWSVSVPDPASSIAVPSRRSEPRPDLDIKKRTKKKENQG
jgi:hypothetical protein